MLSITFLENKRLFLFCFYYIIDILSQIKSSFFKSTSSKGKFLDIINFINTFSYESLMVGWLEIFQHLIIF